MVLFRRTDFENQARLLVHALQQHEKQSVSALSSIPSDKLNRDKYRSHNGDFVVDGEDGDNDLRYDRDHDRDVEITVYDNDDDDNDKRDQNNSTCNNGTPRSTSSSTVSSSSCVTPDHTFRLNQWYCNIDDRTGVLYLVHPPIEVCIPSNDCTINKEQIVHNHLKVDNDTDDNDDGDNDDDEDWKDLDDDVDDEVALLQDEDGHNQIEVSNTTVQGKQNTDACCTDTTTTFTFKTTTTIWSFSIVYSDTYRVPVLYFHVQTYHDRTNGNSGSSGSSPSSSSIICNRRQVVDMILSQQRQYCKSSNNEIPDDTWEFVSQEEHPIHGFPSYFLHPCQSSDRMEQILQLQHCGQKQQEEGQGQPREEQSHPNLFGSYLWTWMSMIFPSIGHPIPSSFFRKIQQHQITHCT